MALIVEDGTGKVDAESYVSVEDADVYLFKRGKSKWPIIEIVEGDLDDPIILAKEASLRNATEYLDAHYAASISVMGTKTNASQALLFPRIGFIPKYETTPIPSDIIPIEVSRAVCMLAYLDYTGVNLYASATQGAIIKRKKIDVIETEWDTSTYTNKPVFDEVNTLLAPLLPIQVDQNTLVSGRILRA